MHIFEKTPNVSEKLPRIITPSLLEFSFKEFSFLPPG